MSKSKVINYFISFTQRPQSTRNVRKGFLGGPPDGGSGIIDLF
jgi:hypothetical protein